MRNVFEAGSQITQISQRHVAIIDDVVTTTATVSAMADILKSHGAARIDVWCVARANSF
jgi:predicted amidophosphoribosyltransferase